MDNAEWIVEERGECFRCSNCDCCIPWHWTDDDVFWNYCPNCGKKMYEEDE